MNLWKLKKHNPNEYYRIVTQNRRDYLEMALLPDPCNQPCLSYVRTKRHGITLVEEIPQALVVFSTSQFRLYDDEGKLLRSYDSLLDALRAMPEWAHYVQKERDRKAYWDRKYVEAYYSGNASATTNREARDMGNPALAD